MSDDSDSESPVIKFDGDDPFMQEAYKRARDSFRYFWRELSWEQRRIVPALDMACVKAPFSDGDQTDPDSEDPDVEHMWMTDIEFDGEMVRGTLINSPNWLKTVEEGDEAEFPISEISDWLYAIDGRAYGGFTVHVLRYGMEPEERAAYDEAWGIDFGEAGCTRVVPFEESEDGEHPMSVNMAAGLREAVAGDPEYLIGRDERGWTMLHEQALAGNAAIVKVLLDAGADPTATTNDGKTPLQLAQSLGWKGVAKLLKK